MYLKWKICINNDLILHYVAMILAMTIFFSRCIENFFYTQDNIHKILLQKNLKTWIGNDLDNGLNNVKTALQNFFKYFIFLFIKKHEFFIWIGRFNTLLNNLKLNLKIFFTNKLSFLEWHVLLEKKKSYVHTIGQNWWHYICVTWANRQICFIYTNLFGRDMNAAYSWKTSIFIQLFHRENLDKGTNIWYGDGVVPWDRISCEQNQFVAVICGLLTMKHLLDLEAICWIQLTPWTNYTVLLFWLNIFKI